MKIPIQQIKDPRISGSGINLFVLRLDLVHPYISGNKWFKLKYNIEEVRRQKAEGMLTFGGAYSNHIAATAAAGKEFGFKTIAIIRGDELASPPNPFFTSKGGRGPGGDGDEAINPTLRFAQSCGMQLIFVARSEYRNFRNNPALVFNLQPETLNLKLWLLPEGGTNELAVKGCAEIVSHIDIPFDYICCPVGTVGTLAGIISSLKGKQKAIGFSVLKDGRYLMEEVRKLLFLPLPPPEGDIVTDYHFGGYGKYTPALLQFISDFEKANNIPVEQVYTGKMMFGIYDMIKKGKFPKNSTLIAIHTGGLQGKFPADSRQ